MKTSGLTPEKYIFIFSCYYDFFVVSQVSHVNMMFYDFIIIMTVFTSAFKEFMFAFIIPLTFSEIMQALGLVKQRLGFEILINTDKFRGNTSLLT